MIKRKSGAATEGGHITIDITLPAGAGRSTGPLDHEAVANYLADMIAQLECLARAANKDMLAYLLSMASVQAAAPEARWERSNALH
jgi:NTP pyrophosphatase (non-canonical NTP hydrolase)